MAKRATGATPFRTGAYEFFRIVKKRVFNAGPAFRPAFFVSFFDFEEKTAG